MNDLQFWNRCSSCKKEIKFNSQYYLCSVSTCRQKRTGYRFCSVQCWDAHLGTANHRSAWAEEARAPSHAEAMREVQNDDQSPVTESPIVRAEETRIPKRTVVETAASSTPKAQSSAPVETLVVVSKVKALIRDRSSFNTSQCCIDALTCKVVEECEKAIAHAQAAGRKTVMGRDVL